MIYLALMKTSIEYLTYVDYLKIVISDSKNNIGNIMNCTNWGEKNKTRPPSRTITPLT